MENKEEEIVFHDETSEQTQKVKGEKNKLAIVAFVIAIISAVAGVIPVEAMWLVTVYNLTIIAAIVLSIVALSQIKKKNQSGKVFAVFGLIIPIVLYVVMFIVGLIEIMNMPEQEFNDIIYCVYGTDCVDNGDGTSTCLYVDESEITCTTDILTEDQFK